MVGIKQSAVSIAVFVGAFSCGVVQAALVTSNIPTLPSPDGQNVTGDTATALEWLDPAATSNVTVVDVVARFATDLAGWRYATREEVNVLLSHMPIPMSSPNPATWQAFSVNDGAAAFNAATAYVGLTSSSPTFSSTNGYVAEGPDPDSRYIVQLATNTGSSPNPSIVSFTGFFSTTFATTNGSWLVRPIPEPTSVALLAMSALALHGFRPRRKVG